MIINYPTGLYNLFGSIEDESNVTWYISNNEPPRSIDVVIKIPASEEIRQIPVSNIQRKTRRNVYGDLVYTINEAINSTINSGKKQYAEGDVLDFSEDDREDLSVPRGKRIEHRHNLNELDTESIGFDSDDINKFNSSVEDKKSELEDQYLAIRQTIENIEVNIKSVQKNINESNKALNAILIIGDTELQEKVENKKSGYESELNLLIEEHEEKVEQLASIADNLFKIDMVAK